MANDRILNIKLPSKLHSDLKMAANERYVSQASLVRMVLAEWVNTNYTADKKPTSDADNTLRFPDDNNRNAASEAAVSHNNSISDLYVRDNYESSYITNKYRMTVEQNIFLAKRNIIDYIWKSAKLEGLAITYPDTDAIYNGLIVSGVSVEEVLAINNLKHSWRFILETLEYATDYPLICRVNREVGAGNLIYSAGFIRKLPVTIGGTKWTPDIPRESDVKAEIAGICTIGNPTDRAITLMLYLMRRQLFIDGNKRTAMLIGNHVMISNGAGILSVPIEHQVQFLTLLIKYYETNDMTKIKQFVYDNCIDGMDFHLE